MTTGDLVVLKRFIAEAVHDALADPPEDGDQPFGRYPRVDIAMDGTVVRVRHERNEEPAMQITITSVANPAG